MPFSLCLFPEKEQFAHEKNKRGKNVHIFKIMMLMCEEEICQASTSKRGKWRIGNNHFDRYVNMDKQ